jgi:hypothetical protein
LTGRTPLCDDALVRREQRTWAGQVYRAFHPRDHDFEGWLAQVEEVQVVLFPGRRATLRHPTIGWPVTAYWGESVREVTSIRVDARRGEHLPVKEQLPLSVFVAALALELTGKTVELRGGEVALNVEPTRPRPGRGPKASGHYERVNERYDELVREGVKAPIRVIAAEYGVQEGTVKVWRWRARKYLRGDKP